MAAGVLVASQSLAAAATLTSASFPYDPGGVVEVVLTNGGTPPTNAVQVILQLSPDNTTWYEVDRRWGSMVASAVSYQTFDLVSFAGNQATYMAGPPQYLNWTNFRLLFDGPLGQSVTIAATLAAPGTSRVTLQLTGGTCTAGGGIASWTPPQAGPLIITAAVLFVRAASTGVANVNIGTATNTVTSATNLGSALNTSTANTVTADPAPAVPILLTTTQVVTVSSGFNTAGFTGTLYLDYIQP